jgi:hypothetical protein
MRENDADGFARRLSDDWAVISAHRDVGEGKDIFPSGIRGGVLTRKTYEISEPRARVVGNTAVVTTKVHLAGIFNGKPFDVMERVSDVLGQRYSCTCMGSRLGDVGLGQPCLRWESPASSVFGYV